MKRIYFSKKELQIIEELCADKFDKDGVKCNKSIINILSKVSNDRAFSWNLLKTMKSEPRKDR